MFGLLSNKQFERIIDMVSQWKIDTDALIKTIANGRPDDQETKDAVAELKKSYAAYEARLTTDEGSDTVLSSRVDALESVQTDIENAVTDIATKLQAADSAGALKAATELQTLIANNNAASTQVPANKFS